jgi:hypothetical protein
MKQLSKKIEQYLVIIILMRELSLCNMIILMYMLITLREINRILNKVKIQKKMLRYLNLMMDHKISFWNIVLK